MGFSLQIHVRLNWIHRIEQQKKRNEIHHIWKMMLLLIMLLYTFPICNLCSHVPIPARTHCQPGKLQKHNDIIESLIYTHAFGIVCFNPKKSKEKLVACYYLGLKVQRMVMFKQQKTWCAWPFFFPMGQDVNKIGILINEFFYHVFNFFTSLKFPSWLMMYFCCRQRKFNCGKLKRENNHTCCSKVQRQKTPTPIYKPSPPPLSG